MAGRFAPGQKAAVTGQLPDFCEQRGTGLGKGDPRVGAGIEKAGFDRAHFRLDLGEEPLHGLFAAQVGADGSRDAPAASISRTIARDLSASRRAMQTGWPPAANRRATAAPIASPAPASSATPSSARSLIRSIPLPNPLPHHIVQ